MSIKAAWITKGTFLIADHEYGYRLCTVSFSEDIKEEWQQHLADDFVKLIIERLELEGDKDVECLGYESN